MVKHDIREDDMKDLDIISHYLKYYEMEHFLNSELRSNISLHRFDPCDTIFSQETKISYFYLLVEGKLRCSHYLANGTLAVVAILNPLCALGDMEITGDRKTTTAATCIESSLLLGIPISVVKEHGSENPQFLKFIIEQLVFKINSSTSLHLGYLLPVKSRIALYIVSTTADKDERICILPSKEEFSSLLGTTERHLNRVLNELKTEGIIGSSYPGVRIKRWDKLNRLIED